MLSFNSTIRRAQLSSSSDLPLGTIQICPVLFVVVVHAGCDKQDALMRGDLWSKLHGHRHRRTAAVIDPIARYT